MFLKLAADGVVLLHFVFIIFVGLGGLRRGRETRSPTCSPGIARRGILRSAFVGGRPAG